MFHGAGGLYNLCKPYMKPLIEVLRIWSMGRGFYNLCKPYMKTLIEVRVYVPWGRGIL